MKRKTTKPKLKVLHTPRKIYSALSRITVLFLLSSMVFAPPGIPKQLFDSKSSLFFNQHPFQFFTSTVFQEVLVMGEEVEGDIVNFNPGINIFQNISIDPFNSVKSWAFAESSADSLAFVMYHIQESDTTYVLRKSSKTGSYTPYCSYQVPAGKSIQSVSLNTEAAQMAIVTTGGTGSNLFYYDF
jgi:hypothetical protein